MYEIVFSKRAEKSLSRIPRDYQQKIKEAAKRLSENPFALDLKKLGSQYTATHRLRIGSYRLFLVIDTHDKVIGIAAIERRTTQTYR